MEKQMEKPNLLLITTDQQHFHTIRALGNSVIRTPNLDRLVREGVAFERAYVANPVCSPSRSSIITGQYPSRHKCWNIGVALDSNVRTIGDELREAGYRTGLFGKAHFQPVGAKDSFEARPHIHDRAFWKRWNGPYYGFQRAELVHGHADEDLAHGMHYGVWLEERGVDPKRYFGPDGGYREGSWDIPEELHYTRWTADRAMAFMEEGTADGSPFFAWCSFQDPHNAYLCPEPWNSMYAAGDMPPFHEREGEMEDKPAIHRHLIEGRLNEFSVGATKDPSHDTAGIQCLGHTNASIGTDRAKRWLASYYAMISLIDHHVGRMLDKLDELGVADNTLIVFTSDHGDYAGNHGMWLKGPIHYEDIVRVPFVARWTGRLPAGTRTPALLSLVDLAPTLLEACGLTPPEGMQGISQWSVFRRPDRPVRAWCLVENRAEPGFYVKTLVAERYKLNYYLQSREGELYDLLEDPHEYVNLYDRPDYAGIRTNMLMQMVDAYGELEPPYPVRQSFA